MSESVYLFIVLTLSTIRGIKGGEDVKILIKNKNVIKCAGNLDVNCLDSHLNEIIRELSCRREISINDHLSVERFDDDEHETRRKLEEGGGGGLDGVWDLEFLKNFLKSHALKIQVNGLVWRIFESRTSPNSLEIVFEPRKQMGAFGEHGKSQKIYRVVIPLILGFKMTGMLVFALVFIKFFLVKAVLLSNLALLVSGLVLFKKLYYYGMSMLAKHQFNHFMSHETGVNHYGTHEPDLSGYGYNTHDSYEPEHHVPEYKEQSYSAEPSLHDYTLSYHQNPYYSYNPPVEDLNKTPVHQTKKSLR